MFQNKIITTLVLAAICINISSPAFAGYQTIYVPDNQTYVGGANGQTIIVQGSTPTQTVIVKENTPQTVVVRESSPYYIQETTTYYPQTAYVSGSSLLAAGVTGLVGGLLISSAIRHHHKYKPRYRPAPAPHHPNHRPPHHGRRH